MSTPVSPFKPSTTSISLTESRSQLGQRHYPKRPHHSTEYAFSICRRHHSTAIWNYFIKPKYDSNAGSICRLCQALIKQSRGSTFSLRRHLQARHFDAWEELIRLDGLQRGNTREAIFEPAESSSESNPVKSEANSDVHYLHEPDEDSINGAHWPMEIQSDPSGGTSGNSTDPNLASILSDQLHRIRDPEVKRSIERELNDGFARTVDFELQRLTPAIKSEVKQRILDLLSYAVNDGHPGHKSH